MSTIPTSFRLPPELVEALRSRAGELGISSAEYVAVTLGAALGVGDGIDRDIALARKADRALARRKKSGPRRPAG